MERAMGEVKVVSAREAMPYMKQHRASMFHIPWYLILRLACGYSASAQERKTEKGCCGRRRITVATM